MIDKIKCCSSIMDDMEHDESCPFMGFIEIGTDAQYLKVIALESQLKEKDETIAKLVEALESVASNHIKIESIENWEFKDAKEVIVNDTKIAREALKQITSS